MNVLSKKYLLPFLFGLLAIYFFWQATISDNTGVADKAATEQNQNLQRKNETSSSAGARTPAVENGTRIAIPLRFRFGNIVDVDKSVQNFDDLLSRYSPSQQEVLIRYYASYSTEAMRFESDAQWQWLVQHGFPLPDEVLASAEMNEDALGKSATQGNVKAAFFWYDRFLSEPQPDTTTPEGLARAGAFLKYGVEAQVTLLTSGSPFAGYVYQRDLEWRQPDVQSAVGYAIAQYYGDPRISEKVPADMIAYNELLKTILSAQPRALDANINRTPSPFPPNSATPDN